MTKETDSTHEYLAPRRDERRGAPRLASLLAALTILAVAALAWASAGPSRPGALRPAVDTGSLLPAKPTGVLAVYLRDSMAHRRPPPTPVRPPSVPVSEPMVTAPSAPASTSLTPVTSPPVTSAGRAYGCGAALAWLSAHAAPGFRLLCPGYAAGHQGMTCVNIAGLCPGERLIAIADPCPAAYMNEASNSWVLTGLATGRLDPYGYCG